MYKYPYINHSNTIFSYGICICGYEFLDTSIHVAYKINADVFPIIASLHPNVTFLVAQIKAVTWNTSAFTGY